MHITTHLIIIGGIHLDLIVYISILCRIRHRGNQVKGAVLRSAAKNLITVHIGTGGPADSHALVSGADPWLRRSRRQAGDGFAGALTAAVCGIGSQSKGVLLSGGQAGNRGSRFAGGVGFNHLLTLSVRYGICIALRTVHYAPGVANGGAAFPLGGNSRRRQGALVQIILAGQLAVTV